MRPDEALRALGLEPVFDLLRNIARGIQGFTYTFMDKHELCALEDVREMNRVYWFEMLEWAHLGAATGLLRQQRWLEGAVSAASGPNFLAFAACLRGFIESSADIWDGLNGVASTLAQELRNVRSAVAGSLDHLVRSQGLEDRLRHFQFARRPQPGEQHLTIHQAKHVKTYLDRLQGGPTGPVHECYAELCSVTHPGAQSLLWFTLGPVDRTGAQYSLENSPDDEAIRAFSTTFAQLPLWTVQQGVNLPLLVLKTLNACSVPTLYTRIIDEIRLDDVPLWRSIERQVETVKQESDGA